MKITILYDNISLRRDLLADWGFSALIEFENHNILFDAGGNGKILMGNMDILKIDHQKIDTIFISHHHFDHVGGLSAFLNENNDIRLYSPFSFRGVKNVRENIYIKESQKLYENIYTTGELDNIEQSLILKIPQGLVLIVGCAHAGLDQIIATAENYGEVYAIVGGFHGYRNMKSLENIKYLCPTHCSKFIEKISSCYPHKYIQGGVGQILEF